MVVAGRVAGDDVAIMMVEAEATTAAWNLIKNEGKTAPDRGDRRRRASRPPSRSSRRCARRSASSPPPRPSRRPSSRASSTTRTTSCEAVTGAVSDDLASALTIADKQERETELDRIKDAAKDKLASQFEGREKEISGGVPRGHQEARPAAHPARQGPHRRPWPHRHPHALGRGRGAPARARLGAVRARRDPDPRRHHAEHAAHGADARHAQPGEPQALHAQLQLPALLDR